MRILVPSLLALVVSPAATAATGDQSVPPVSDGAWIALAMVAASVLTAWLLNYSAPKVRAFGTLLAALGCFAVVIWFTQALATGILEHPKPNQTPMDSAKPTLLWIQASVALLSGLILLWVAYRQGRSTEALALPGKNEPARYGRVSRIIHWTTAILIIILIPMGIFGSMIPTDAWFLRTYFVVHKTIGVLVFALLLFRLLWNMYSRRPKLDGSLKPMERKLAHGAHVALYVMMFAMPVTGYVMTSLHGFGTYFFAWEMPPFLAESKTYVIWGGFHKYLLPYLLYMVLGAHVLGALKHQFVDKHGSAFKRMVS